ncbi:hypothetical protein CVV68_08775 [Arthrobacter livingstonensis]|uniref:Uncharacterized protein n=1 Tax=Arthrobacter livingstonensis TaxID=670078 RepID=A0A2V5L8G1_9MICC|nr:hypothetical protein [Arthrobacter livingstonensis]PYI67941.1 hypothetical protein CVV68_08775 [Arthrobacter livingstonensis]
MSTPNEHPGPEQPGHQAPPPGYQQQPPPGYQQPGYQQQPPPGYQQPGYQQQPPPGYQQPGNQRQAAPSGGSGFEMPSDWPRNMNDVIPAGGFSGLFKLGGLPQLLKVSYIIWLVTAVLWLIGTFFSFLFSLLFVSPRGVVASIISLALIVVLVVCAMKLKEGRQWARLALSVIAVLSIVMAFVGAPSGLLGIVATVLMWLPESSAWLNAKSRGAA